MNAARFIRLVSARTKRILKANPDMRLDEATARAFGSERLLMAGKLQRSKGRTRRQ